MKKNRLKKWLIGIGCILVILLVSAYFGINYAADKVMDKLSDSILESAMASPSSSIKDEGQSSPIPTGSPTPFSLPVKGPEQEELDQSVSGNTVPSGQKEADPNSTNTTSVNGNSTKNSNDNSGHAYSAEVSIDKAQTVKEEITFGEKTKLMTIMLKRLSASDIKTLSDLASGGLSVEKKVEAKKIILEKLSEKEYDELIKIAQKYGMSEGKSYDDSKKEKGMQ
ncbi:hypothetical protein [Cohnella hashimotonis]|uniref:Uncharacterized protein n=1 Tax=Cohnella hashimotonis TaxID=2826895 RepID=A0ABT6TVH9_9BACL|nr:hypothetical protein [Cohnella hashimotonis]MDI4650335.1 hypothetical protein [Cohnella hashimotonis]